MSDVVIRAERLGKKFRIGTREPAYRTLRDSLITIVAAPLRRLGNLLRGRAPQSGEFEEIWALKDVSFEVKRGEVLGIIGRNGAGKSTLLKILSRITEPTEGRAEIRGRLASLLEVGTGFHPELTGRENVYLNGAMLGMRRSEITRKFDEIVGFSEVEKFIDTPVKNYSSGMYLRLAFAVAAHLEPEILLVDEVLAVGDAPFQKKCLGKLGGVAEQGRTVLFVSHNLTAVARICNRVVWLNEGRVSCDCAPATDAIERYLRWLGTDARSAIESHATPGDDRFRLVAFAITDEQGAVLQGPVAAARKLRVRIRGRVVSREDSLQIGFALYDSAEQLLFWSCHTDGPEDSWPKTAIGPVALECELPVGWLNQGSYRLIPFASVHERHWILKPDDPAHAITLELFGSPSSSPLWGTQRPGVLAPVLPWRSHKPATATR